MVLDLGHRRSLALAVSLTACGPAVGDPAGDGNGGETSTGEAPSSSTAAVSSSSTSNGSTTADADAESGAGTSSSSSSSSDDGETKLDASTDPPTLPDPGEPPDTCTMPAMLDADVLAMTPSGEATFRTAVFAATGGGKCPIGYRVLLATDLDALPIELDHAAAHESFGTALLIDLDLPPGSPEPGEWDAYATVWIDGDLEQIVGTVSVTAVTRFDDPSPLVEGTLVFSAPEWGVLEGSFSAPYCNLARGPGCGA